MDDPGSRRGRAHNAEAARKAILDAAEEVFAEHGFDGARIDVIAAKAGYNKSLIFQYFDDKLNLYSGVIRRADDETRGMQNQMLEELLKEDMSIDAKKLRHLLGTYVGIYFDFMLARPNFMRILNWELAEGWQTYSKVLTERDFQDVHDFSGPLQKISEGGFLRSDFNPMAQIVVALFMNHVYLGILPFFKVFMPNFDFQSDEGKAAARAFLIDFITTGLIKDPKEVET